MYSLVVSHSENRYSGLYGGLLFIDNADDLGGPQEKVRRVIRCIELIQGWHDFIYIGMKFGNEKL